MTPLTAVNTTAKRQIEYSDQDSFDALYHELEKGIQGVKYGEVYSVDEAWKEIDNI